jgi:hypothetical protein
MAEPEIVEAERPAKLARRKHDMQPVEPMTETGAIIAMIERAARDPAVDIDKMERLMAMRDRVLAREAQVAFDAAFAEMQPDLPVIEKKGRIEGESKRTGDRLSQAYGRWEDIAPAIVPTLSAHGFGIRFEQEQIWVGEQAKTRITCVLSHAQGHREKAYFDLPLDTTGSKNNVQAYGSTASYGKRYSAMLALNIVTKGEDDDGEAAGADATINDKQIETIRSLIIDTKSDPGKFCAVVGRMAGNGVERIEDIPVKHFDAAVALLRMKQGAAA